VYLNDDRSRESKEHIKQEEEAQKENSAGHLSRSKAVLDHTNTVLAVGEGRHRN